ncbi:Glycosyl-phosphatidyl inositol-anchored, plant [Corchorus capsularis]|uniref:Glycosyl-phosphatidyl inositol-anchored, plant n=1 Tax=Corchorus capsularis TaxID=210143 RepID=A0A1R3GGS2_COCAP|nr:Glycosyl-phosphatidyl inositol-anchored, plant [Corchorus capsularis]
MLGIGDVVIPGIFVALALKFDVSRGKKSQYFKSAFLGYTVGLVFTIAVMNWFQAAQLLEFDESKTAATSQEEAYDALDPTGNITIKWDVISCTLDGYVAVATMYNFQQYRHIQAPGWTLGWTWAKKEVIWNMMGGQTTEQGDCSKFKGNVPHCCKMEFRGEVGRN